MTRAWMITGIAGQLGGHLAQVAAEQGIEVCGLVRPGHASSATGNRLPVDLADPEALEAALAAQRPAVVLHAAAVTSTAVAFRDAALARRVNVDATRVLLDGCERDGGRLVLISTDMVFSGARAPYREGDPVEPLSVYGQSKVEAEQLLLARDGHLVVRLPLLVGLPTTPRQTTFSRQVEALRRGDPQRLFADEFRTPAALRDAARAVVGLAQRTSGLWHVAGPERLSRLQIVERIAQVLSLSQTRLEAVSRLTATDPEPRPADLSLRDDKLRTAHPDLACGHLTAESLGLLSLPDKG